MNGMGGNCLLGSTWLDLWRRVLNRVIVCFGLAGRDLIWGAQVCFSRSFIILAVTMRVCTVVFSYFSLLIYH